MRLLHTADWHLGHALHRFRRASEHAAFLEWLVERLVDLEIDALLICGDIFDTANPPAEALRVWYHFLAEARRRCPDLDVVVIGGNHDSASRLDAPAPLLDAAKIRVIGGLAWRDDGQLDVDRMVVPVHRKDGSVGAQVIAVPFLRLADLPIGVRPAEGVQQRYEAVVAHARAQQQPGQALVALGHAYLVGTSLSELSERKVLGGNQHALPIDAFPADAAYVALGHLHLAQSLADGRVRYSGSPLPLSFAERTYTHQVVLVELEGEELGECRAVPVPRVVDLIAIPEEDPEPLETVLAQLAALPRESSGEAPFLEVRVRLDAPAPALRETIEEALLDKAARLVRIATTYTGHGLPLPEAVGAGQTLADLTPEEVFRRRWERDHSDDPDPAILDAFHAILDQVRQDPS